MIPSSPSFNRKYNGNGNEERARFQTNILFQMIKKIEEKSVPSDFENPSLLQSYSGLYFIDYPLLLPHVPGIVAHESCAHGYASHNLWHTVHDEK